MYIKQLTGVSIASLTPAGVALYDIMASSRQPTADSRQPIADSRQPTADSRQPTADSRQPMCLDSPRRAMPQLGGASRLRECPPESFSSAYSSRGDSPQPSLFLRAVAA